MKFSVWLIRLLLAMLLLFASEILLWTTIQSLSPVDWLIHGIGSVALATLILDLAARYRSRDTYDVMVIFAIYGLLAALLTSPSFSFANFPMSLLTRVLGGYSLVGIEIFGLFLVLTAGQKRRYRYLLLAVTAWLGFYWGIWLRWSPEFSGLFSALPLETHLLYAAGFFALPMLLWGLSTRLSRQVTPLELRLTPLAFFGLVLVLLGLFMAQAFMGTVDLAAMGAVTVLVLVCWAILWFRREANSETLLDQHFPMQPLNPIWLILAIALFIALSTFSYQLPLVGTTEYNQLWLMEIGFALVGASWLPLIAIVIAIRGIDQLMRTNQL